MSKMRLRKGDRVYVVSGKDKGKEGATRYQPENAPPKDAVEHQ